MFQLLCPDQHLNSIFELDPEQLRAKSIKGIIIDMDNTLISRNNRAICPRLRCWLSWLKEEGFYLCIVSNNIPGRRRAKLALDLDIPAIWYAVKPRRRPFRKALEKMKLSAGEAAVIGDQIFTDVLGGNRLGLYTILVIPISAKEFIWTRLMRRLEQLILNSLQEK